MNILGIIPARYDSVRFPGKPLAMIFGKTMIQRVYEQCKKAESLSDVIVATDDERIYQEILKFGGKVIMTGKHHLNGTSRCNEVLHKIKRTNNTEFQFIINIQGDEPFIQPEQINELTSLFNDEDAEIVTQVKRESDLSLLKNQNIVKALVDNNNYTTDFQRIITNEDILKEIQDNGYFYKHIGIYGFKQKVLAEIVNLAPSLREKECRLEQMRWLDNNFKIKSGITDYESISIDTKEDLERALSN